MRDHTKLRAFELADSIVLLIYQVTRKFPKEEVYGLTSTTVILRSHRRREDLYPLTAKQFDR